MKFKQFQTIKNTEIVQTENGPKMFCNMELQDKLATPDGAFAPSTDCSINNNPIGVLESDEIQPVEEDVAEEAPVGRDASEQPDVFEQGKLDFGQALRALKKGYKVARLGWNGKGMFLWLKPGMTIKSDWCRDPVLKQIADHHGGEIEALGTICMFTRDSTGRREVLTGWLASQSDMLCEDWAVLDMMESHHINVEWLEELRPKKGEGK